MSKVAMLRGRLVISFLALALAAFAGLLLVRFRGDAEGFSLQAHESAILRMAFNNSGTRLATVSRDCIRTWDIQGCHLQPRETIPGVGITAIAWVGTDGLVAGEEEGRLFLSRGGEASSWKAHANRVICLDVSSDGSMLATGGAREATLPDPASVEYSTLAVWSLESRRVIARIVIPASVTSVRFLSNDVLVVGCEDGRVRRANLNDTTVDGGFPAHTQSVIDLVPSPSGSLIATFGLPERVRLWAMPSATSVKFSPTQDGLGRPIILTDSTLVLASGLDNVLETYSLPDCTLVTRCTLLSGARPNEVTYITACGETGLFAVGTSSGGVRLASLASGLR
jgi:WD40 repeat protein